MRRGTSPDFKNRSGLLYNILSISPYVDEGCDAKTNCFGNSCALFPRRRAFASGQIKYLPHFPGRVSIQFNVAYTSIYQLSTSEAEAFHGTLGQLRSLLLATSTLNPPHGLYTFEE
jgi:hypothetical protein